jgi:anaerobic selenocysteine-containing dehydrogenase
MFLGRGNPLFTTPGHHDLAVGLGRIPLVVSFDSFISETSQYADLILPDHTFLERWDEVSHVAGIPFAHLGIQQPVVDPVHDTRHSGDVLASLATAVGPSVSAAFGFDSYREAIRQRARSIYESGTGTISTSRVTAPWLEFLQERGWHLGSYTTFDSFWEELLERGAWWNPAEEPAGVEGMFQNRTGKSEFYASALVEELSKRFESNGTRIDDRTVLPHFEPPPAPDDNMGLQLVPFETLAMRDGSGANQPMMHEILGLEARHYWRTWAEINPETARKAGVSDGQWVWLESVIGSIRVVVRVTPGIAPDVVGVPIGLGHTSFGRYGEGHGADPVRIVKNQPDRFSGHRGLHGTSVRIVQTA